MPRRWGAWSGGGNRTPCIRTSSRTSTDSAFGGRSRSPRAWRVAAASSGAAGANAMARSPMTTSTASRWCCQTPASNTGWKPRLAAVRHGSSSRSSPSSSFLSPVVFRCLCRGCSSGVRPARTLGPGPCGRPRYPRRRHRRRCRDKDPGRRKRQ